MLLALFAMSAQAAAPQQKTQAPGYYRWMLGDVEVTALSDGTFDLDTRTALTHTEGVPVAALLERGFDQPSVPISVNAYLVNTGRRLMLFDTGAAQHFGATLGQLAVNLVACGYRPEQVDDVFITHMHPDHIGGLSREGSRVFPNATVHVEQREATFWTSARAKASAAADRASFFDVAVASIAPYSEKGALDTFDAPARWFDSVQALPAPGHTPGHTVYVVESKGRKLAIWGDLVELDFVQFAWPDVMTVFDEDAAAAASVRPRAYEDAAAGRYWLAVTHLPFPGIGHLRKEGDGYAWVPIRYDRIR